MQITKMIVHEEEIEIHLGPEDLERLYLETPTGDRDKSLRHILQVLSIGFTNIQKIPDSILEEMDDKQREIIIKYLQKQLSRIWNLKRLDKVL